MRALAILALAACATAASMAACSEGGPSGGQPAPEKHATPQPDVAKVPTGVERGEWLLHGLSPGEQRYSPLDQIRAENVEELGLAFEYDNFVVRGRTHRGVESTALMDDGVLFFTGPWSVVYAVDARTGEERWVYDPQADGARVRVMCCDAVNRGIALQDEKVFVGTIDGYLVALDQRTGEVVWRVDTFIDRDASYSITGAPRLTSDLVVIGNGGAEMGVRGYITAYELDTGKEAWRFFTVPSAGPDETLDISRARETWSDQMPWEYGGGGTVWDSMVYDEALDTLYVGVGNGSPWPVWERGGGDNLYLSSVVALDAKAGRVKWHYQTTPGDSWDYTATQHMILADLDWNGTPRKVLLQAPKNGFFYVLDRETGELLSAEPYVTVTWASQVDAETGRPILTENANYSGQARFILPSAGGGHSWPSMAYNPDTGLVYIPANEAGVVYTSNDDERGYIDRSVNQRVSVRVADPERDAELLEGLPPFEFQSHVLAWDPVAGEARWQSAPQTPSSGGVLTTAGNLVIGGTSSGQLQFYDAASGTLLRSIEIGTAIMAPPITYELDGQQHIAVLAGHGGGMIAAYIPGIAPMKFKNSGRLLVYKLGGGETPLPPPVEPKALNPIATGLPTDPDTIARGAERYERFCVLCHLPGNWPSGYPDLWNMPPEVHDRFDQIVLEGAYEYAGMASFSDVLGSEDTLAIRAYIAADRRKLAEAGQAAGSQHSP